jgi:hypothetical protein
MITNLRVGFHKKPLPHPTTGTAAFMQEGQDA